MALTDDEIITCEKQQAKLHFSHCLQYLQDPNQLSCTDCYLQGCNDYEVFIAARGATWLKCSIQQYFQALIIEGINITSLYLHGEAAKKRRNDAQDLPNM